MTSKKWIFALRKLSRDQNLKNHFPKGIFNKIWLKVAEHEYIYIFEIKFEKKNAVSNVGQNKAFDIAQ